MTKPKYERYSQFVRSLSAEQLELFRQEWVLESWMYGSDRHDLYLRLGEEINSRKVAPDGWQTGDIVRVKDWQGYVNWYTEGKSYKLAALFLNPQDTLEIIRFEDDKVYCHALNNWDTNCIISVEFLERLP
jgi:hypothetical protein